MAGSDDLNDAGLYRRGLATLVAAWEEFARGSPAAMVQRRPGAAIAVFPSPPERAVYNNALLERGLGRAERTDALDEMEAAYAAAGITDFRAWAHEADYGMHADLRARGYAVAESTRAMGMALDNRVVCRSHVDLGPSDWSEYLRIVGVPPDFLRRADRKKYHVLVARLDGESVAAAMAFDCERDCGIYNMGTLEHARRRGIATGLLSKHLHDARARGCDTATLQSTPMAEPLYRNVGFRDLGRIVEYSPPTDARPSAAHPESERENEERFAPAAGYGRISTPRSSPRLANSRALP